MQEKADLAVAEWKPAEAESFWKACYAQNLEASRLYARSAYVLAALLAKRFALPSRVLLIGERDPSLAEALLTTGFLVARADIGPWLREPTIAIERNDRWLGSVSQLKNERFDVVLSVGLIECLSESELAPCLAALRCALGDGAQVVIAVPNGERLEQQLAVCPKTHTMFHREQRVRAFDRFSLRALLASGGLKIVSQLEIDLAASLRRRKVCRWQRHTLIQSERRSPHRDLGRWHPLLRLRHLQQRARRYTRAQVRHGSRP